VFVTITTLYITHSKFEVDRNLLGLYVNNAEFYTLQNFWGLTQLYSFGMIRWG